MVLFEDNENLPAKKKKRKNISLFLKKKAASLSNTIIKI